MNPQDKPEGWEKIRDFIVDRIHILVESEVSRVDELRSGATRRDGGRQMNEEIVIRGIVESVHNFLLTNQPENSSRLSESWQERFVEVMNGLGIDRPISTKLFNFMHYEIAMVRKSEYQRTREEIGAAMTVYFQENYDKKNISLESWGAIENFISSFKELLTNNQ